MVRWLTEYPSTIFGILIVLIFVGGYVYSYFFQDKPDKLLYRSTSRILMGYQTFYGFIASIALVAVVLYLVVTHFLGGGFVFLLLPCYLLISYKALYPYKFEIFEDYIKVNGEKILWSDVSDVTLGFISGTIKIKSNKPRVPASIVFSTSNLTFSGDKQRKMIEVWRCANNLPKVENPSPPWKMACIVFVCGMCICILIIINIGREHKKEKAKSKNLYKTEQKEEDLMLKK